ncbi:leucine-rich repeat-containing protein 15-like [Sycon ciliatum]|uniref:leucine-rich repeat-containing protein 15-like n=1 Tax=Sycon ciliatum TaxID=27933 RepID=UPI0031F6570C
MRTLAILMLICMAKMALAEPEPDQNVTFCGHCQCRGNNIIGCRNVAAVFVDGVVLPSINPGIFDHLYLLKHLNLANLHIEKLNGTFSPGLEMIHLSGNNISSLLPGVFSGMLESLSLDFNHLTALPEDLFADCPHLDTLGLYDNKLRELPSGLFRNNQKLFHLNLGHNFFSELPSGLITYSPLIRWFSLYRAKNLRLNHQLCELVTPRNFMTAYYDFTASIEVKNYIKENLPESFCHSSCENIPKNERRCQSGCIGTVYNYTCVDADTTSQNANKNVAQQQKSPVPTPEVKKANPLFTDHEGKIVCFYLPAVKPGYSRQLVGIGQHGSVNVSKEFKNSQLGDRSYVFVKPGYDSYGFQYVRDSDGRRSPVGAEFSLVSTPVRSARSRSENCCLHWLTADGAGEAVRHGALQLDDQDRRAQQVVYHAELTWKEDTSHDLEQLTTIHLIQSSAQIQAQAMTLPVEPLCSQRKPA